MADCMNDGYALPCRPNAFGVITANRVIQMVADSSAEMHMWIGALSPRKFSMGDDDVLNTCLYSGQQATPFLLIKPRQLFCFSFLPLILSLSPPPRLADEGGQGAEKALLCSHRLQPAALLQERGHAAASCRGHPPQLVSPSSCTYIHPLSSGCDCEGLELQAQTKLDTLR